MAFTIGSTLAVVLGVIALWMRADLDRRRLLEQSTRLVKALSDRHPDAERNTLRDLVRDVDHTLHQRGIDSLDQPDRRLALGLLRAAADSRRARITASIELMPQLGLLGTVIGLMYTMLVLHDTSVSGIGTALLTTFAGLVGLLAARLLIEPSADDEFRRVVHLLDDPRLAANPSETESK
jgi:biopolymer transport protein ExbB/TolQ